MRRFAVVTLASALVLDWLVGTAVLYAWSQRVPPGHAVLFRWHDPAAVDPGNSLVTVLNPRRDRAPERVAATFLRDLRAGRCPPALVDCEREREFRPITWRLRDRTGEPDGTHLFYAVYRLPVTPIPSNTWITVNGGRVRAFEAWY